MDYSKIIEYFAQKVDESRRDEFIRRASELKDPDPATVEKIGREFGIPEPTEEDRKAVLEMADELSEEMLMMVAGGNKDYNDWDWEDHLQNCISWGTYRP